MMRYVSVVLALAIFAAGASAQEGRPAGEAATGAKESPARPDVRGVWKITELASRAPARTGKVVPRPT